MDIFEATKKGDLEQIKRLLEEGEDVNARTESGHTALLLASSKGYLDVVKYLVEQGAEVNVQSNSLKYSPLITAAEKGHFEVVSFLVQNGADLSLRATNGLSALWVTCSYGKPNNYKIAKFLIENGSKVDAASDIGRTPLMISSWDGDFKVSKLLMENGADITLISNDELTAVGYAKKSKNWASFMLLFTKYASRLNASESKWLINHKHKANLGKTII